MSSLSARDVPLPSWFDAPVAAEVIRPGLEEHVGGPVEIIEIIPQPFDGSSSFAACRIEIRLTTGRRVPVFVKNLDPRHLLAEAKLVRDATFERSRREVHVYRDILPGLDLGTPTAYGIHWDEDSRRFWLLLEDAGPKRLSRLGDVDLWVAAVAWLGRFHSAVKEPTRDWGLPGIERSELGDRCGRVVNLLDRLAPETRGLVEQGLANLDEMLDIVFRSTQGMVHGEFFGKNVVIRPLPAVETIAVIDWETAAVGPQVLDLVSMTAGRWTAEQRSTMWRAYFESAAAAGTMPTWDTFIAIANAAAAVNALAWLGWWSDGDDAHITRWTDEVCFVLDPSRVGQR